MIAANPDRTVLRREAHDVNDVLADLLDRLDGFDADAARCVKRARSALFEAWTILCTPPEEEEDD